MLGQETPVHKSRARDPRGVFIRRRGAAHRRADGWQPRQNRRIRRNRPHPSAMPGEIGPGADVHPMQESSMQVMHALTTSRRRDPRVTPQAWDARPWANAPGDTGHLKPVGKPGIFVYKSDPRIQEALTAYRRLLREHSRPAIALQHLGTRYPWVLTLDTARGRDWWAAVRRADLPYPAAFDLEIDPDANSRPRPRRAVFWREDLANLGQGIMAPTGSGGAGR